MVARTAWSRPLPSRDRYAVRDATPPVDGPHDYFQLVLKDNELDWRLFTQSAPIPPECFVPAAR